MIHRTVRVLLALLTVAASASAQDASAPATAKKQYVYKHEDLRTGSHIPTNMTVTEHPLHIAYADLSPEQKASWKSQYRAMPTDDEPPYPKAGIHGTMKAVLKAAQYTDTDGEISAVVVVRDNGAPDSVRVLKAPSTKLGSFVAQALMLEKFKPAVCAGKPCAMEFPFNMRITLTR